MPSAIAVETPKADNASYPRLFAELWRAGRDFLLIEQDIEVHESVQAQLEECPEPWCGFEYLGMPEPEPRGYITYGLGCTRYRSELMSKMPALANIPSDIVSNHQQAPHWARLDAFVKGTLLESGAEFHVHQPPVKHHHNFYPLGCACGELHDDQRYVPWQGLGARPRAWRSEFDE